jgi:hypothetical protein
MEQHAGYFCRAYIGQDVQANVIARTLREAELEITRMIRGGAMTAHAVQHGWPDQEPVLVASAYGGTADGEMWRYLRQSTGPEFERWQTAYHSKTKILDARPVGDQRIQRLRQGRPGDMGKRRRGHSQSTWPHTR